MTQDGRSAQPRMHSPTDLIHIGGGVSLTAGGGRGSQRMHQHPDDGDLFLTSDELAAEFVEANEGTFDLAQVDREVLSTLWQIGSVEDVQRSELFLDSAKQAVARSAGRANEMDAIRMLSTQGIAKHLVHPLPSERTRVPGHPFEAKAVNEQFLAFEVFPQRPGETGQVLQFHLELQAARDVPGFTEAQVSSVTDALAAMQTQQEPTSFGVGCRVTICGLRAKPEHNGAQGKVRSHDASSGRNNVQLSEESGGVWLKVRSVNLRVAPALEVSGQQEFEVDVLLHVLAGCLHGKLWGDEAINERIEWSESWVRKAFDAPSRRGALSPRFACHGDEALDLDVWSAEAFSQSKALVAHPCFAAVSDEVLRALEKVVDQTRRESRLAAWREATGAPPGTMPTPQGFLPGDAQQNAALADLEPDVQLLSVTDVVTAVTSGRFGQQAIARLHGAVKKKAASRYLDDSLINVQAALLGEPKFNAVFWVSTDPRAPLQFKGREPYKPNAVFMHFASRLQYCDHCANPCNGDLSISNPSGTIRSLKKCGQCNVAVFCDRSCQEAAWALHKKWCRATSRLDADTPFMHVGEIRSEKHTKDFYRAGMASSAAARSAS